MPQTLGAPKMTSRRRVDKRTVFIAGASWWGLFQAALFLAMPVWPRAVVIACALGAALVPGAEQSDAVLWTIRGLTALVPACTLGAGVFLARGYTLGRGRHNEILAALARRGGPPRHDPPPGA